MANEDIRILDLIPESLRDQLFLEVQEELKKKEKEQALKKATPEQIKKILSLI